MAHTTTKTPATGWWAAELVTASGQPAENTVEAITVLAAVLPGHDLALDPNRMAEGLWLIELPDGAIGVLATQGFLELGQPHLGLIRIEADAI